jgi:hypothetical protein
MVFFFWASLLLLFYSFIDYGVILFIHAAISKIFKGKRSTSSPSIAILIIADANTFLGDTFKNSIFSFQYISLRLTRQSIMPLTHVCISSEYSYSI